MKYFQISATSLALVLLVMIFCVSIPGILCQQAEPCCVDDHCVRAYRRPDGYFNLLFGSCIFYQKKNNSSQTAPQTDVKFYCSGDPTQCIYAGQCAYPTVYGKSSDLGSDKDVHGVGLKLEAPKA